MPDLPQIDQNWFDIFLEAADDDLDLDSEDLILNAFWEEIDPYLDVLDKQFELIANSQTMDMYQRVLEFEALDEKLISRALDILLLNLIHKHVTNNEQFASLFFAFFEFLSSSFDLDSDDEDEDFSQELLDIALVHFKKAYFSTFNKELPLPPDYLNQSDFTKDLKINKQWIFPLLEITNHPIQDTSQWMQELMIELHSLVQQSVNVITAKTAGIPSSTKEKLNNIYLAELNTLTDKILNILDREMIRVRTNEDLQTIFVPLLQTYGQMMVEIDTGTKREDRFNSIFYGSLHLIKSVYENTFQYPLPLPRFIRGQIQSHTKRAMKNMATMPHYELKYPVALKNYELWYRERFYRIAVTKQDPVVWFLSNEVFIQFILDDFLLFYADTSENGTAEPDIYHYHLDKLAWRDLNVLRIKNLKRFESIPLGNAVQLVRTDSGLILELTNKYEIADEDEDENEDDDSLITEIVPVDIYRKDLYRLLKRKSYKKRINRM